MWHFCFHYDRKVIELIVCFNHKLNPMSFASVSIPDDDIITVRVVLICISNQRAAHVQQLKKKCFSYRKSIRSYFRSGFGALESIFPANGYGGLNNGGPFVDS